MTEIVYILSNPYIPDLIIIGTTQDLKRTVKELSAPNGVPAPFMIKYASEVEKNKNIKEILFSVFGDYKVDNSPNFFKVNTEKVIPVIEMAEIRNILPGKHNKTQAPSRRQNSRRSAINFSAIGLKKGQTLHYLNSSSITATIENERQILFEGKVTFISTAAKDIQARDGSQRKEALPGPEYWFYQGESLSDRRLRMELDEA